MIVEKVAKSEAGGNKMVLLEPNFTIKDVRFVTIKITMQFNV